MIKSILFMGLVVMVSGCAATSSPVSPKIKSPETQDSKIQIVIQECNNSSAIACKEMADYYYDKSQYEKAARQYDSTCSKFQYIPACLKLAYMFEHGQGVEKNPSVANDIYTRACYSGDKDSCKMISK